MWCELFFLILIGKLSSCDIDNSICDNVDIQKLCLDQEKCDQCLNAHECCNWCYDENYHGRRCNSQQNKQCRSDKIEYNGKTELQIPKKGTKGNMYFTNIKNDTKFEDVIQIKPQEIRMRLRQDTPINFTFTYKSSANYPLDLYYLGDLSASMANSLKIFKTLGRELPDNLTQLTKNYRLAYGSFMDKTGMPFYVPNICSSGYDQCEEGYLFRHRLNFTRDTQLFTEKIINSKITANLDDLDGALDAIWQILVCPDHIGWDEFSRKIILLPTDSLLHMAGDGKLVGAIQKPKQKCLLDENGNHKEPLKYDFPSIGEIDRLLKDKKVNIIFAVKTASKKDYYTRLTKDLVRDSAYVGQLETDSSNIIQLITTGFNNFVNQVSFSVNTSHAPYLSVKFYADCEHTGNFNETNTCYGVATNPVDFKVEVTLNSKPPRKTSDILYIQEKNIIEQVVLNITYSGICNCENYNGTMKNCNHGEFSCGDCICDDNWTGDSCDEDCSIHDSTGCASDGNAKICSGQGDCLCGKCNCEFPFDGAYCQYECPASNEKICGGPSKGTCLDGRCICKEGFIGENCNCSISTENCYFVGINGVCSNHGKCECNTCQCFEDYSGDYCEIDKNNTLCEVYRVYIEDAVSNKTYTHLKDNVTIESHLRDSGLDDMCDEESICHTAIFEGTRLCTIDFCYQFGEDDKIHLLANSFCVMKAELQIISIAGLVFATIIIGGLVIILISKIRIYRMERAEYKEFEEANKIASEMNPLYKSPTVMYKNPLHSD